MDRQRPQPEIVAEGLTRSFGTRPVLRGINLTVHAGDLLAIVGASGCGKTVLVDHLTGLMTPDQGRVLAADHDRPERPLVDLAELDSDALDALRLHWQVVFQRNALFSGTVRDNIALWLREHTDLDARAIEARSRESLAAVALDPDDVLAKDRDELSGGMAKRVAIARAIAADPIVVFYDEPTTGLDPVVSGHIHELIWRTHHRPIARPLSAGDQRTTVIVTHDRELLRRLEPRIVLLDRGSVAFTGTYAAFAQSDNPVAAEYLRIMPVLHARNASP
jgi:phospholipid/cholesterol/gamma-HCH transport system ATP-binding protein